MKMRVTLQQDRGGKVTWIYRFDRDDGDFIANAEMSKWSVSDEPGQIHANISFLTMVPMAGEELSEIVRIFQEKVERLKADQL